MNDGRSGVIGLYLDSNTCSLDSAIMRHIANEVAKLLRDGMSDLEEYGSGDVYYVNCDLVFTKKEEN